jgi:hypothetical protein
MHALYFVRCRAYVVAKSKLHNEFSQNIFPLTPHGNGNIGWASAFKLASRIRFYCRQNFAAATVNYWQSKTLIKKK